ncbi:MAG: Ig-like domain-containing protein, partial [Pseudomonadota bacterium]|nr:Ig-like domain-containing protein [Pseudomonadota bacterium]
MVVSFSSDDDITVDNGTLATMTSSNNITWTGTFTPTAGEEEPNNTLSLATSYTDLAGNAGPSETTANYAIDTLLPTISSVTAGWGTYLNATEDNSDGTVTVVTSGAEDNQTVTVTLNSTNYTGTVSDNSTAVNVAASGLQALTDGSSYTLTTNVSDAAGNAATVNTGTSFTYDITAPTISGGVAITSATGIQNNLLNAGDNVSVTVTFSENVPVTDTPQLTLAVGDDNQTATYASGSGSAPLVFTYTIQAGDNDTDGISIRANALALNSGTISDLAGNNATLTHSAVSDNNSYMVDTDAPRVDNFTLSDMALKVGDNATVNLGFSETVIEFIAADINLDNATGTLPSMTSSDNITWAGTFTPTANREVASNTLSLTANSYTDLAGNAGPSETTANYAIDTLLPSVSSIEISATGIQNNFLNASDAAGGDVLTLSVIFRESVIVDNSSGNPTLTLVAVGDDNQTATYTAGSGATMVFQYTIRAGDNDTNGISIGENALALNSGTIRDAAGNNATITHDTVSDDSNYKVDTTPPTVSDVEIASGTGMLNDFLNHPTDVVSATVTFSENSPVTGTPQLTLAVGEDNHTADYTSSGSGTTTKVFTYTIQAGDNDTDGISIGANALALNNGTISDPAGNNAILTHSAVSSNNRFMVDTEAPTVNTFTISDTLLLVGETMTVNLGFSEAVISFSAADITAAGTASAADNGTLATMTSSDNITWSGTFTPAAGEEEPSNTLSVSTNYTDLAGNTGTVATTTNYEVDTLAPSGTFSFTDYNFEPGDNATVRLVFNEVVVGFSSADDITVPNLDNGPGTSPARASGTLAAMTSSDNITWSGTFTPTFPNTEDCSNRLSLAAASYTDVDNNTGTAATSPNYMVDDIPPSTHGVPTLTLNRSLLLYDETATLTVVFPEPVTSASFSSAADINLDNATGLLSTMSPTGDGTTWTGTFTPIADREVPSNTITLEDSWTDQVGNPGTSVTTSNFEVETLRPSASSLTFSVTQGTTYNGSPYSGTDALKPGDNATLTVVFSDPVVSFSSADISHPNV